MSIADVVLLAATTPWERAVEKTSASRWKLDADLIRRAQDPWACPEHLLPWLAYNRGVDFWFDDWDEMTKRRVIAEMPRLQKLKGTLAGLEGYLALISAPVTYATLPPADGFFEGELSTEDRVAWLARLPQLRLYPFRDAGELDADEAFFDDEFLLDDEDPDGSMFSVEASSETAYIWKNGAEEPLAILGQKAEIENGIVFDTVQVSVPEATDRLLPDEADLDDVLFDDDKGGIVTVRLRQGFVAGSDALDVTPIPFSEVAVSTGFEPVFEEVALGLEDRFFDDDLCFDDEDGPLFDEDRSAYHVYRRTYLLDPNAPAPVIDGDLCFDDHVWDLPPYNAIIGVDLCEPGDPDAFVWDGEDGYFDDPPHTRLERAIEAVRCAQGDTDTIIVDPVVFRPLTFGDRPRPDGSLKFGQMIERKFV